MPGGALLRMQIGSSVGLRPLVELHTLGFLWYLVRTYNVNGTHNERGALINFKKNFAWPAAGAHHPKSKRYRAHAAQRTRASCIIRKSLHFILDFFRQFSYIIIRRYNPIRAITASDRVLLSGDNMIDFYRCRILVRESKVALEKGHIQMSTHARHFL